MSKGEAWIRPIDGDEWSTFGVIDSSEFEGAGESIDRDTKVAATVERTWVNPLYIPGMGTIELRSGVEVACEIWHKGKKLPGLYWIRPVYGADGEVKSVEIQRVTEEEGNDA